MNIYVYLLQRRCTVSNTEAWIYAMGPAILPLLEMASGNLVDDGYWLFLNIQEMTS